MSMSVHVRGYETGEDMSDPEAGVELGYGPHRIRIEHQHGGVAQHNAEMEHGFDVDLDGLDPKLRRLRFFVSF
jgi:hypothetical protein